MWCSQDETGSQEHPWAVWTRGWTAEENRHGLLLNRYLYLSGRYVTAMSRTCMTVKRCSNKM